MNEQPQQTDPDVPHDDELDIEGPNESTQPQGPMEEQQETGEQEQ